jgi:hypothetical protein
MSYFVFGDERVAEVEAPAHLRSEP